VPKHLEHLWDGKTEFKLGITLSEAYRTFADRMQHEQHEITTMQQLSDKYEREVVSEKAPSTQKSNRYSLQRIRTAFGNNSVTAIEARHIYQYREHIGKTESEKKYNLDHEVLSHMFTKSIEWGLLKDHPMTGKKVTKYSLPSRDRYVEDWELEQFFSIAPPLILAYLSLKGLTGLDKGDLLSIKVSCIGEDGITVEARKKTRNKRNGRKRTFPFVFGDGSTTGIKEALDIILNLKGRPDITPYLFCTTKGKDRGRPYIKEDGTTSGFDSIWQRVMKKALKETKLVERFTEHDLRAKVASDAATDEEAQRQLDHTNVSTTRAVYRRAPIAMPVSKGFSTSKSG
jgi:integrase